MRIAGIVCEYNPLHRGHQKQMDILRAQGYGIVCLMSGNFVQRGYPAVFDKRVRAEAAVKCGADLVLELPIGYALSSAEGFAYGGVEILSRLCDTLCFGAETADADRLMATARRLLSPEFSLELRHHLDQGFSFPASREKALSATGMPPELLTSPNNILGVEYCKAILSQGSPLTPMPILRQGNYHDSAPDVDNPSATSLRSLIENGAAWTAYVPPAAAEIFAAASVHTLKNGEKAMLSRLRTMTDAEFEALPYGSEGLWRKLMHESRRQKTLEDILTATKSKRYTRTRLDRMAMCAFLGLTAEDLRTPAPYCRVLAFNENGRNMLKNAKESGFFVNIGTDTHHPYQNIERRATALYGLFADAPEPPDAEENYRIYYQKI